MQDIDIDLKPAPRDFKRARANTMTALKPIARRMTLKKFKHAAFASRETLCFSADLYIDGSKVASVHSDGNGGEACLYFADHIVESSLQDEIKQRLEQFDGETIPVGIADLVAEIADDMVEGKQIASFVKKAHKRGQTVIVTECGHLYGIPPYLIAKTIAQLAQEGKVITRMEAPK